MGREYYTQWRWLGAQVAELFEIQEAVEEEERAVRDKADYAEDASEMKAANSLSES